MRKEPEKGKWSNLRENKKKEKTLIFNYFKQKY